MSVVYGALIGATVGWAAWWLFLLIGRRRIVGRPVNAADPEVMALVVSLAETGRRAGGLKVPDPNLDISWTAKELAYQIVDQNLSDHEFAQLRYQAKMLDTPSAKRSRTVRPGHRHRSAIRLRHLSEGCGRCRPHRHCHRSTYCSRGRHGRDRQPCSRRPSDVAHWLS